MLNPRAVGYTVGLMAGVFWLVAMILSLTTGIGVRTMTTLGSFHPYFTYSWIGMVIIVIEHLIGGFVAGWIFGALYNRFSR